MNEPLLTTVKTKTFQINIAWFHYVVSTIGKKLHNLKIPVGLKLKPFYISECVCPTR